MEYSFTAEDRAFRDEVRAWLRANVPTGKRPSEGAAMRAFDIAWQRRQYDGGWAGSPGPPNMAGAGSALMHQLIWHEEYARAGAPPPGCMFVALNHGGPTLMARGSGGAEAFHLPRILSGERRLVPGFLRAGRRIGPGQPPHGRGGRRRRSRRQRQQDLDELRRPRRLPGAAGAHRSRVCRATRASRWVICDMRTPGIAVRPIRTMAGIATSPRCSTTTCASRSPTWSAG